MSEPLSWALPVMRAGYAGRGVTYLAIAGISLWSIWQGGDAQGTDSVLERLNNSGWGMAVLVLIALGLLAYAVWRLLDAAKDLERYGSDGKGIVARLGMVATGLIHGALAVAAAAALGIGGASSGGGGSSISGYVGQVMGWPGGRWIVGLAGLATIGAGIYYAVKAYKASYRKHLVANEATRRWNDALRAGVAAQAVIVTVVGGFLLYAALQGDSGEAGGLGQVFDWLRSQPFGQILVTLLCVGLLGFALFCFVNAAYRIVPALYDDRTPPTTLKAALS